jgi:hypothetical protein
LLFCTINTSLSDISYTKVIDAPGFRQVVFQVEFNHKINNKN